MPNFLAALMALVSTFAQNGKPATFPPHTQDEVSIRGSAVSNITKNATANESVDADAQDNVESNVSGQTPDAPKNDGRSFGHGVSTDARNQGQASVNTDGSNGQSPDTTKVAADNTKSGKSMPTFIPQVAIDHSVALDASSNTTAGANNQNVNAQGSGNANASASFGQGIANSQPDSAKADGQTFGQSTAISARSNSRRP